MAAPSKARPLALPQQLEFLPRANDVLLAPACLCGVHSQFAERGLASFAFKDTTTPCEVAKFWDACWNLALEIELAKESKRQPIHLQYMEAKQARNKTLLYELGNKLDFLEWETGFAKCWGETLLSAAQQDLNDRLTCLARERGISDEGAFCDLVQDCFVSRSEVERTWDWPLTRILEHCLAIFKD